MPLPFAWGCKAWKLIPPEKRSRNQLLVRSEEVRFLGITWPNPKALRVLTSKGKVDVSRHVEFEESAPPACESRADFSPFMETEIATVPEPVVTQPSSHPSPAVPSSSSPVPASGSPTLMLPPHEAETQVSPDQQFEVETPAFTINPLFDSEHEHTPSPSIPSPSNIPLPAATRRSEQSNKGVQPDTYRKFVSGLPGAKCAAKQTFSFPV
jgi:hypothetical protein